MSDHCGTCSHFWSENLTEPVGNCHRYPPPYPRVIPTDWCGEYATTDRQAVSREAHARLQLVQETA